MSWIQRRAEGAIDSIIGFLVVVVGAGILAAVWAVIQRMPAIEVVAVGLVVAAAAEWIVIGLNVLYRRSRVVFDAYTIVTTLAGADLSGLSEPESFMMITLNVRNVSGYPVTITGVKGRIRCAGAECNLAATVEREPRRLGSSDRLTPCTVRQPLTNDMMNEVALASDLLRISLSGLQWVGTVALPRGSMPLEGCYIHEDFLVRGPFREKRDAGTLFRQPTTFLSSEHFDSDGAPKQAE